MAAFTSSLFADTVAEWKFDQSAEISGGNLVTLDKATLGASTSSELMKRSTASPESTGLGEGWQSFLKTGFLEAHSGNERSDHGLVTKANAADGKDAQYRKYFGRSGIKPESGGTVYMVVSPRSKWSADARCGLMSTGHRIDGYVSLMVRSGGLVLEVGGKGSGNLEQAEARVEMSFDAGDWYFVAASWKGGSNPVLYVRRMLPVGPSDSPPGITGTANQVCGSFEQPRYDPIAIGAEWINTGAEKFTTNGAGARIAYARLDNQPAEVAEMEAVFTSLGAAAPAKP
ncbi:MAG: hypothetical protein ACAI35_19570 [Candidatus Methylacidiphilales bacterium]